MTRSALDAAGLTEMDPGDVADYLRNERVGVLGLPAGDAPYTIPISFGYEDGTLYFTFVGGTGSRKRELIAAADTARFLVYSVESMFSWESVMLTGTPEQVPEPEWEALSNVLGGAWRPAVFEEAVEDDAIAIYRFDVTEQHGIRHAGLPPAFEA